MFDYLKEHLDRLDIPVLGGLPIGHGPRARPVPIGAPAHLDANAGTLTVGPSQAHNPESLSMQVAPEPV